MGKLAEAASNYSSEKREKNDERSQGKFPREAKLGLEL